MLFEIINTRQIKGEGKRRWFRDDDIDLIIWYGVEGKIAGFQLCYDKQTKERCLTWRPKNGFRDFYQHDAVDDGETPGHAKMSPVLVADGKFEKNRVSELFDKKSGNVDDEIASFVLKKIMEYEI